LIIGGKSCEIPDFFEEKITWVLKKRMIMLEGGGSHSRVACDHHVEMVKNGSQDIQLADMCHDMVKTTWYVACHHPTITIINFP